MPGYLEEVLFLRDDPFKVPVPQHPEVWATSQKIKDDIDKIIGNLLVSESSSMNVFWGTLGTGKTYTANYYSYKGVREVLKNLKSNKILEENFEVFCFPRFVTSVGGRRDIQFLEMLMSNVSLCLLKDVKAKEIFRKAFSGQDNYINSFIEESILSFELNQIVESNMSPEDFLKAILKGYLPCETEIPLTRVPFILETFVFIMKVLTHPEYGFRRVFIWIDEAEKFADMPSVERAINQTFLRDCFDRIQEKMHIFLLITTARPDSREINAYLSDFLVKRLTYVYELPPLYEEEMAVQYVKKLLDFYRTRNAPKNLPPYFPFTEESVRMILRGGEETYTPMPPRDINIQFEKALSSLRREKVSITPEKPVTPEQLKAIMVF